MEYFWIVFILASSEQIIAQTTKSPNSTKNGTNKIIENLTVPPLSSCAKVLNKTNTDDCFVLPCVHLDPKIGCVENLQLESSRYRIYGHWQPPLGDPNLSGYITFIFNDFRECTDVRLYKTGYYDLQLSWFLVELYQPCLKRNGHRLEYGYDLTLDFRDLAYNRNYRIIVVPIVDDYTIGYAKSVYWSSTFMSSVIEFSFPSHCGCYWYVLFLTTIPPALGTLFFCAMCMCCCKPPIPRNLGVKKPNASNVNVAQMDGEK